MEAVTLETLTLLLAFLTLLGAQIGGMFMLLSRMNDQNKRINDMNGEMNRRFETVNTRFDEVSKRFDDVNRRFDTMNQRFDETTLVIGELRDRTGRLEGTLEGFLAGLRNRDVA